MRRLLRNASSRWCGGVVPVAAARPSRRAPLVRPTTVPGPPRCPTVTDGAGGPRCRRTTVPTARCPPTDESGVAVYFVRGEMLPSWSVVSVGGVGRSYRVMEAVARRSHRGRAGRWASTHDDPRRHRGAGRRRCEGSEATVDLMLAVRVGRRSLCAVTLSVAAGRLHPDPVARRRRRCGSVSTVSREHARRRGDHGRPSSRPRFADRGARAPDLLERRSTTRAVLTNPIVESAG